MPNLTITDVSAPRAGAPFVPAPAGFAGTAGCVVSGKIGAYGGDASARVRDGALCVSVGGKSFTLSDYIESGWLHAGDGGIRNAMFEAQEGVFPLFSDQTTVETVAEGDACRVLRASTPLALSGATAYADLYFWRAHPLVTIRAYLHASDYTPVRSIHACRARAGTRVRYAKNNAWVDLPDAETDLSGGHLVCRDAREFGASDPFVAHLLCGEADAPIPEAGYEARPCEDAAALVSGDMTLRLVNTGHGLRIAALTDAKSGSLLTPGRAHALFRLLVREGAHEYMIDSDGGWGAVRAEECDSGRVFRFEKPELPALRGVSVTLTAVLEGNRNRISWEIDARCRNEALCVVRLDPPALTLDLTDDTRLFAALGPGQAIPLGRGSEKHILSPYPSIGIGMQYMALYRQDAGRGVYFGLHDPLASYKMLLADAHDGVSRLQAMIPARGIDEAANGFHMDGQLVWQLFDGDWYDATMLYRAWVHACASWFPKIPATKRRDVPEWLLKAPLWFQSNMDSDRNWMENLFEAQDDIGVPAAVHMYNWHQIPFDTNYPHYNPAKPEFERALPVLQAHGLKVMPYINGRLWDTHDRGDYDFQFTRVAKPYATKGRGGEVITERYNSKNTKGESVELGVMCPSTALWQEKQSEINSWILNGLGADAVYVDQIAAAPPVNCMDGSHPHRKGGGSWWYEHYYNLIDHLLLRASSEKCFTTESNAEPFVGHIGGMLVWHWSGDCNVPAFPAVYAGYQPMLGRNYNAFPPEDGEAFRIMTAQSLCFGDQIGWLIPTRYLESPYRTFFREAVRLRYRYNAFFYAGRCLRPPRLEGDIPILHGGALHERGVLSALWELEGKRCMILVNLTEQTRDVVAYPDGGPETRASLPPLTSRAFELNN